MSLDDRDRYELGSIEVEVVNNVLDLSPEDVLELSEPEYRKQLLGRKKPLTKPVIQSVENSVGRERKRLEEWYDSDSGSEKWDNIWRVIAPRWTHVISELDERTQRSPGAVKPIEEKYRENLSQEFREVDNYSRRLGMDNPDRSDIRNFVEKYRELEDVYEKQVHPNIGPEDL